MSSGYLLGILTRQRFLVVDPSQLRDGTGSVHGDHAAEVPPMIAFGIGFLALFSVLSIMLGNDEPRRTNPQDDVRLWMRFVAPTTNR